MIDIRKKNNLAVASLLTSLCIATASCTPTDGQDPDEIPDGLSPPGPIESVSVVGWKWQAPEGRELLTVEPVAMGAAAFLDSGVVVLHGATGEEVWSHLVPEGESFSAGLTVDGSALLVAHGPSREESPEETLVLDPDTGAVKGEFQVRGNLAPWDLQRVGDTERVHRPAGVVEEYRPLSVIELADGTQRWEQEEPLACETAPELPSSQDDTIIHGSTLLVLVTCAPERFTDPFELTTAVVAVDLADGSELWRQEFTYPSDGSLSHAFFAVDGDSVLLATNRIPEVHVIGSEDGEIRATAQGTVLAFHDGDVLLQVSTDQEARYELRDTALETTTSVEVPERFETSAEDRHTLPLRDGVVGIELAEESTESAEVTVGFTSWETGEVELLGSGLPAPRGAALSQFTGSLVNVPGAVVLVGGESWGANELVAYQ